MSHRVRAQVRAIGRAYTDTFRAFAYAAAASVRSLAVLPPPVRVPPAAWPKLWRIAPDPTKPPAWLLDLISAGNELYLEAGNCHTPTCECGGCVWVRAVVADWQDALRAVPFAVPIELTPDAPCVVPQHAEVATDGRP